MSILADACHPEPGQNIDKQSSLIMATQQPSLDQDTSACTQQSFDSAVSSRSQSLERLRRSYSSSDFFDVYRKAMPTTQGPDIQTRSASKSTMTLHEEGDDSPAITLTTYMMELPERPASRFPPALRKLTIPAGAEEAPVDRFNPCYEQLHNAEQFTDHIELAFDHTQSQNTTSALEKLKIELDEHCERLKTEYEQKRGRKWTPLRPHDQESWVWECELDDSCELTESSCSED
jgi:hypothetical protein